MQMIFDHKVEINKISELWWKEIVWDKGLDRRPGVESGKRSMVNFIVHMLEFSEEVLWQNISFDLIYFISL